MKTQEVERCPKCGAYCFPEEHASDACVQIEELHRQNKSRKNRREIARLN
jgi:uncharacterized OB-fold protein